MTNYMIHWPQWNCKCMFSLSEVEGVLERLTPVSSHMHVDFTASVMILGYFKEVKWLLFFLFLPQEMN